MTEGEKEADREREAQPERARERARSGQREATEYREIECRNKEARARLARSVAETILFETAF